MDNLTHSLIGATIAELGLPPRATPAQRTLIYTTAVVAANLPDGDLLYSSITPPPLGYLLHHRGHTHTIVGLAGLAAIIGLIALVPRIRALLSGIGPRFSAIVAASLASHLIADAWNSYGVHPFYPFDNRWFYGDAVYILEPWIWMLLGVTVVLNMRGDRGRLVVTGALIAISLAAARAGLITAGALIPIAAVGAAFAFVLRRRAARTRSLVSFAAMAAFVVMLFSLERVVRAEVVASPRASAGTVLDVVLSPIPARPICWNALSIERDDAGDAMVLRRGTVALGPAWLRARACRARERIAWQPPLRQSATRLRALASSNCWMRAWLQFGRAPVVDGDRVADYRFGNDTDANFTAMNIPSGTAGCPAHLPNWTPPRADILLESR